MIVATRAEIERALAFYQQKGDAEAVRKLTGTLKAMGQGTDGQPYAPPAPPVPEQPGVAERAAGELGGALEAAATVATGAIAAPLAGIGGAVYETARQILNGEFNANDTSSVGQFAERAAKQAVYEPRTEAGQRNVRAIGAALEPAVEPLQALGPLAGEASTIAAAANALQGTKAAVNASGVPSAIARTAATAGEAAATAGRRVGAAARDAFANSADDLPPLPGTPPSVGAAGVPAADVRRARAAELGFKDESRLMQSQATQDPQGLGFLTEQAKSEVRGPEIRTRQLNQARQAERVFDNFVDQTGGSAPDFSGGGKVALGNNLQKVLTETAEKQKNQVRVAYNKAEAQEGGITARGDDVAKFLKDNENLSSPLIRSVKAEAKKLGIIEKKGAGAETNLKTLYELRKFVSRSAGPADGAIAREIKSVIDARIAADGGPLYQQATRLHARFKAQYSDASLIDGIIKNKPGSPDRVIAADQILNRMLSDATSVDELKHARRLMTAHGGEAGAQAWKDFQAGGIEYLRDLTYKRAKPGPGGVLRPNATQLNNAVNKLDQAGKLDAIYGKQGAEKIRLFRDIVRSIENAGEANFSGTSSKMIEFLESIPVAGKTVSTGRKALAAVESSVRDKKLRDRIRKELE